MQPTPNDSDPAPVPPAPESTDPVVEMVRAQRTNAGLALSTLVLLLLVAAGFMVVKGNREAAKADDAKAAKADDPLKPNALDGTDLAPANRYDYVAGAILTAAAALACAGVAAILLVGLPKRTTAEQRTEARTLVFVLGGALGGLVTTAGIVFLYRWSDSIVKWLDAGDAKEARWVVGPLLLVVFGAGLAFFASLPARAEERDNPTLRRFVYGNNFVSTILLVFVALVIGNAAIGPRIPNKLDTTSTGFYSLSSTTKQFVEALDQPIRAYAILEEGDLIGEDTKRLLSGCQDVNPAKFRLTAYNPAINRTEINKLKNEYPLAEMSREGILLVAGEEGGADRKRHTFLRVDELSTTRDDGIPTFNGESKLLRELMYLAENKQKPKVYFTQSSGELALAGGARGTDARRTASGLKAYLEKNYFDVAELTFDPAGTAKVPDDAAVVVVADPVAPLPPNGVEALRKYMNEVRPDGKKGKLVVLVGAQVGANRAPLQTGLEPLLQQFGVRLSDRFLFGQPIPELDAWDRAEGARVSIAVITQEAVDARNPVALNFNKVDRLPLLDCREVASVPGGAVQVVPVLASQPGRTTWGEREFPRSPLDAWQALTDRAAAIADGPGDRATKQKATGELYQQADVSRRPRELAVFASEGETPRLAVFGCGWFVSDAASGRAARAGDARLNTVWLDMMGSTLDWVRERPTVTGVTDKTYSTYTLKPGFDSFRMVWVPVLLAVVGVGALSAGVWAIRRK